MEIKTAMNCLNYGAKALRFFRQRKILVRARNAAATSPLALIHHDVFHTLRKMEMEIAAKNYRDQAVLGGQVCTSCKNVMGVLLELPRNQLNCSIKLLTGRPDEEAQVVTWARSEPTGDRDQAWNPREDADERGLSKHSAGAAIYGLPPWNRRFPCFSCNDLPKCSDKFICPRPNWVKYYRSLLVFPMQYARNELGDSFANVGFLCFDSPQTEAFLGSPNIFDYHEPTVYRDSLERCMQFHVGALFADMLGSVFRNWDSQRTGNR